MQLLSCLADQRNQLLFDKVMDIFRFRIVEEIRLLLDALADLVQRRGNQAVFGGNEDPRGFQRLRMGAAAGEFVAQQLLVKGKGPLPLLEMRI
jgi:hypothetical protein